METKIDKASSLPAEEFEDIDKLKIQSISGLTEYQADLHFSVMQLEEESEIPSSFTIHAVEYLHCSTELPPNLHEVVLKILSKDPASQENITYGTVINLLENKYFRNKTPQEKDILLSKVIQIIKNYTSIDPANMEILVEQLERYQNANNNKASAMQKILSDLARIKDENASNKPARIEKQLRYLSAIDYETATVSLYTIMRLKYNIALEVLAKDISDEIANEPLDKQAVLLQLTLECFDNDNQAKKEITDKLKSAGMTDIINRMEKEKDEAYIREQEESLMDMAQSFLLDDFQPLLQGIQEKREDNQLESEVDDEISQNKAKGEELKLFTKLADLLNALYRVNAKVSRLKILVKQRKIAEDMLTLGLSDESRGKLNEYLNIIKSLFYILNTDKPDGYSKVKALSQRITLSPNEKYKYLSVFNTKFCAKLPPEQIFGVTSDFLAFGAIHTMLFDDAFKDRTLELKIKRLATVRDTPTSYESIKAEFNLRDDHFNTVIEEQKQLLEQRGAKNIIPEDEEEAPSLDTQEISMETAEMIPEEEATAVQEMTSGDALNDAPVSKELTEDYQKRLRKLSDFYQKNEKVIVENTRKTINAEQKKPVPDEKALAIQGNLNAAVYSDNTEPALKKAAILQDFARKIAVENMVEALTKHYLVIFKSKNETPLVQFIQQFLIEIIAPAFNGNNPEIKGFIESNTLKPESRDVLNQIVAKINDYFNMNLQSQLSLAQKSPVTGPVLSTFTAPVSSTPPAVETIPADKTDSPPVNIPDIIIQALTQLTDFQLSHNIINTAVKSTPWFSQFGGENSGNRNLVINQLIKDHKIFSYNNGRHVIGRGFVYSFVNKLVRAPKDFSSDLDRGQLAGALVSFMGTTIPDHDEPYLFLGIGLERDPKADWLRFRKLLESWQPAIVKYSGEKAPGVSSEPASSKLTNPQALPTDENFDDNDTENEEDYQPEKTKRAAYTPPVKPKQTETNSKSVLDALEKQTQKVIREISNDIKDKLLTFFKGNQKLSDDDIRIYKFFFTDRSTFVNYIKQSKAFRSESFRKMFEQDKKIQNAFYETIPMEELKKELIAACKRSGKKSPFELS